MVEVCGYCKDTHGRHFLGCPYVDKASDTVGQVAKDVRVWETAENKEIDKWRQQHGYTKMERSDGFSSKLHWDCSICGHYHHLATKLCPEYPMRTDGVLQATEPVREGDVLIVGEGGYSAAKQNPKDIAGSKKPAYDLLALPSALNLMAGVMKHGANKYGRFNWRSIPISSPAYYAAIGRHWAAMASGEWLDSDSGLPHVAHVMATCAIMLDADAHGTLKK